jgi:glucose/arabinose dehydrogenase
MSKVMHSTSLRLLLMLGLIVSLGPIGGGRQASAAVDPSPSSPPMLFGRRAEPRATTSASGLPGGFRDERVAGGNDLPAQYQLSTPTGMAFLPDGRLLVTEKAGKLRLVKNNLVQPVPALDWTAQAYSRGDAGLIGVAVDRGFATNGYIYLAYTSDNPHEGRVSRFT